MDNSCWPTVTLFFKYMFFPYEFAEPQRRALPLERQHCHSLTSAACEAANLGGSQGTRWAFDPCSSLSSVLLGNLERKPKTQLRDPFRSPAQLLTVASLGKFNVGGHPAAARNPPWLLFSNT